MRIMTESEYQRCIEAAEKRGYEEAQHNACIEQEMREYREATWREMREMRQEIDRRIERLEKATGKEYTLTCGCEDAVTCKPAPF